MTYYAVTLNYGKWIQLKILESETISEAKEEADFFFADKKKTTVVCVITKAELLELKQEITDKVK